jgi:hypothetical protein
MLVDVYTYTPSDPKPKLEAKAISWFSLYKDSCFEDDPELWDAMTAHLRKHGYVLDGGGACPTFKYVLHGRRA